MPPAQAPGHNEGMNSALSQRFASAAKPTVSRKIAAEYVLPSPGADGQFSSACRTPFHPERNTRPAELAPARSFKLNSYRRDSTSRSSNFFPHLLAPTTTA